MGIYAENMKRALEHKIFLEKMHKQVTSAMNSGAMYSFGKLCDEWLKDPVGRELALCLYSEMKREPESIEMLLTNSDVVKRRLGELAHDIVKEELKA